MQLLAIRIPMIAYGGQG
uniref:Uncharacterized protein n=1 Tax=Rhizophora mucronata TaxID=61149 RepID=A0A2P2NEW0_RHIMU